MHALESIDFANPANFLLTTCYASLAIFGRYLLLCLGFSLAFERSEWQHRKIAQFPQARAQKWKEIGWSALSSVLFAIVGTALLVAWQLGYTQIYTEWDAYSWVYLPISALLFLFFMKPTTTGCIVGCIDRKFIGGSTKPIMTVFPLPYGLLFLFTRWKAYCSRSFCQLRFL